jgi:HK97 family phage portal protein
MSNPPNLPAVIENPPLVPQLITLTGAGWEGMKAWALPSPKAGPQNNPNIITQTQGGFQLVTAQSALAWEGNARTYRALSLTPWVRAAIKIRRDQIASAQWDIVKADPEGKDNKRLAKRIAAQLDTPNARNISAHSFFQEVVEDLLVLDGSAIEKVRYPGTDEIAELWPTPAEYIAIDEKWDGSNPERPRYYYVPDGQIRARFKNDDMIYMMDNPRTVSALGISPIRVLLSVIDSELQAMEYNRRMVMGAPPNGALNIGDSAMDTDVERARGYFQSNVFGQSAMAIIGGFKSPSFMQFGYSNADMQFGQWQDLLLRCIAVVYGLSPMDMGITFDVNRSTANAQQENTEDRGLRPLLDCVQRYLTREFVWDESFGGRENNLKFAFTSLNLNETEQKANINRVAMPGVPTKSVNEARDMDGRQPKGRTDDEDNVFNHLIVQTPKGMLDLDTQKYIGEEQLAELAAETQTKVAETQGDIDAENADKAAQNTKEIAAAAPKPAPAKGAPPK